MKTLLLALALLIPATTVNAQYYNGYIYGSGSGNSRQHYGTYQGQNGYRSNVNYQQYGNNGYGNVQDNRGNRMNYDQQRIGNTTYDNYRFNDGRNVRCTTTNMGSMTTRNCR